MSQDCEGAPRSGEALGYEALLDNVSRLNAIDAVRPIVATFTLDQVPEGVPPAEVRQQCVGVEIPLRRGYADRAPFSVSPEGSVEVAPVDVILSLLLWNKVDAAKWFRAANQPREYSRGRFTLPDTTDWEYERRGGTVKGPFEKLSSFDYYGQFVPDVVKRAIDALRDEIGEVNEHAAAEEVPSSNSWQIHV